MGTEDNDGPQGVFPDGRANGFKAVEAKIDATAFADIAVVGWANKFDASFLCFVHAEAVFFAAEALQERINASGN